MKDFQILKTIVEGEYSEPVDRKDLLDQAGRILDKNCSGEIVGDNLFLTDDGRLITTSVEVIIREVTEEYAKGCYASELYGAMIIKCSKCGNWHHEYKGCPTVEHKSLNPVLVYVEGGLVQNIYTDADVDVILIDGDVKDGDNIIEIPDGNGGTDEFYVTEYSADRLEPLAETCDMKQILSNYYERDGVM